MSAPPVVVLWSRDPAWRRRIRSYLGDRIELHEVSSIDDARYWLRACAPCQVWIDIQALQRAQEVHELNQAAEGVYILLFGPRRSDAMRHLQSAPVCGTDERGIDRFRIVEWFERTQALIDASVQTPPPSTPPNTPPPAPPTPGLNLGSLTRLSRSGESLDQLLSRMVEGVESSIGTARTGLFVWDQENQAFTLKAGLRCLAESHQLRYPANDPLPRFFEQHLQIIQRSRIDRISEPDKQLLMRRHLDLCGAEIFLPLFARNDLLGWLFLGNRINGTPFSDGDIDDLITVAEHISTTLENALLYEAATVQHALATTLLHAIPSGIIAVDPNGIVRWFNEGAERLLHRTADQVLDLPAGQLGSPLAHLIHSTLKGSDEYLENVIEDTTRDEYFLVQVRKLYNGSSEIGAVALLQDKTRERHLEQESERVERSRFWTELAGAMSHEIRNPLVTIKTFAQLLPSRYQDEEFREEFSRRVNDEADRLNRIVEQINDFAHPPPSQPHPVQLAPVVEHLLEEMPPQPNSGSAIRVQIPADLPPVFVDQSALQRALGHLLDNALEAVGGGKNGHVTLTADTVRHGDQDYVRVTIEDNGQGVTDTDPHELFSPFYTTKARGMGLGLPIAQRIARDHNGSIDLHSTGHGTKVIFTLPVTKVRS